MTFGKPKLGHHPVFCLNCGETYPEHEVALKHAGRTEEGDFWNDKCPVCGAYNSHVDVDGRDDPELREEQHKQARARHRALKEQGAR